jgi:hypothetical protein
MDTRKLVTGTLVGGVAMFVLGYLIFDLAFAGYYAAHAGSATGVAREPRLWWATAIGTLSLGTLITLTVAGSGAKTLAAGFKTGAIIEFLVWLGVDFLFYGSTNINTIQVVLLDPVLEFVRGGLVGAAVVMVLGRGETT